jgi:hypothetical protein
MVVPMIGFGDASAMQNNTVTQWRVRAFSLNPRWRIREGIAVWSLPDIRSQTGRL